MKKKEWRCEINKGKSVGLRCTANPKKELWVKSILEKERPDKIKNNARRIETCPSSCISFPRDHFLLYSFLSFCRFFFLLSHILFLSQQIILSCPFTSLSPFHSLISPSFVLHPCILEFLTVASPAPRRIHRLHKHHRDCPARDRQSYSLLLVRTHPRSSYFCSAPLGPAVLGHLLSTLSNSPWSRRLQRLHSVLISTLPYALLPLLSSLLSHAVLTSTSRLLSAHPPIYAILIVRPVLPPLSFSLLSSPFHSVSFFILSVSPSPMRRSLYYQQCGEHLRLLLRNNTSSLLRTPMSPVFSSSTNCHSSSFPFLLHIQIRDVPIPSPSPLLYLVIFNL